MTAAIDDATLIEDVEWLIASGEHLSRIPRRVGVARSSIGVMLRRAGRLDLARPFEAELHRELRRRP